jgi:diguanylate cyclase (GGDEF)-like protein
MAVAGPPDGRATRAVTVAYEYPPEIDSNGNELLRHGVAVPIPGETTAIGYLVVFSRAPAHAFADSDKRSLEDLASRAGPAIENARRFREARQLADLDALTGLHNRRFFHETLAREVARAHRYRRKLALVVFDLDDFKAINDRIGHLAGDGVLAEVAERVRSVVRSADIACRVGGDEFGIILPESNIADAEQLSHRMQAAVAARPIGDAGTLQLSAGAAELETEDDATRFFERADDALYRAKESGKAEVVAAGPSELPETDAAERDDRAIGPLG